MKKKILLVIMLCVALLPCTANAKRNPYYTEKGTIRNFTYSMRFTNGSTIKGKGYRIYLSNGNVWEMTDADTDQFFKEGQKVKVKFNNNGTAKNQLDDYIVSIKKAK